MKVLMTCVAGYGHLHPLLPLAEALAHAGHQVAIATASDLRAGAEAAGFTAFDAGLTVRAALGRLAERFPAADYNTLPPDEILGWYLPRLFGEILAPAMLTDLEPLVRTWRPDVVVHETFEFAGPIAAASAAIPSISHTLGLRHADRILESVATAVTPLWLERGLDPDPDAGLHQYLCLDITPPSFQRPASAADRDRIHPLRPTTQRPVPTDRLPAWMARRRDVPLVYMTLGTNTNSNISVFRGVIDGLSDLPIDVLLTIGFGKDPELIGSLPPNAHVENYVPQSLLLPRCSVVLCHAGAGTTLGALALGLLVLALPQGADQYVMAELVHAAGAGLVLDPAEVNPASVRASVLELLHNPAYRFAARRLQREIAAMPGPDAAVNLIEQVVRRANIGGASLRRKRGALNAVDAR